MSKPSSPPAEALHEYSNDEDGSFAWVAMNAQALYERYPKQWILVDKARAIGSAKDPEQLIEATAQFERLNIGANLSVTHSERLLKGQDLH